MQQQQGEAGSFDGMNTLFSILCSTSPTVLFDPPF
jgi:hypothetical protein